MSNLHWLPIEPTPFEQELMRRQEAFVREVPTAFALMPEEIGTLRDSNLAHAQRQEAAYQKMLERRWGKI